MLLHDVGKPSCFSMGEDGRGHFYGHPAAGEKLCKSILQRLKSDNATLSTVCTLVRVHDMTMPTTVSGMRKLVGRLGEENVHRLLEVQRADHAAHSDYDRATGVTLIRDAAELLEDVLEMEPAFTVKDLAINGNTLMQLGMKPGPAMKQVLETLLAAVQEGKLENTPETLTAKVRELI